MPKRKVPPNGATFANYVVLLIDFLGQGRAFARWDYLPQSKAEQAQFIQAVRGTYAYIMRQRKQVQEKFTLWKNMPDVPGWVTNPRAEDLETCCKYAVWALEFLHFSDTINPPTAGAKLPLMQNQTSYQHQTSYQQPLLEQSLPRCSAPQNPSLPVMSDGRSRDKWHR